MDLQERKKAFEAKFKNDEENKFKIDVRRSKLVGLWAAELMGLTGAEAEVYARTIVDKSLDEPGWVALKNRIAADLAAKGVQVTDHTLDVTILEKQEQATASVMAENK